MYKRQTWTLPGQNGTNMVPILSLCFPMWSLLYPCMFCVLPTWSLPGPVLTGSYLATTWSLLRPYVDPTWFDWYQHASFVVFILSPLGSLLIPQHVLRTPYMLPTWSCADLFLPSLYLVASMSLSGPYLVTICFLCGPYTAC